MVFRIKFTAIALAIGMLTGCGGGGGGGGGGGDGGGAGSPSSAVSSAALTSSNQTVAAQDVAATAFSLFDSSRMALGVASSNESALFAEAFSHLDRLPNYMNDAAANATAIGAIPNTLYNCALGGNLQAVLTDADNSNTVSSGDSASITFNNCVTVSGTMTGTLDFRVDSISGTFGTAPYTMGVTMTFGSFALSASTYSASVLGSITVTDNKTGTNASTRSISTKSLRTSATYAGVTRTRTLTDYSASETRTPNATYTYSSSYSLGGTLTSSGFSGTQAVSFSTPTTIVRRGTDFYPYTGVLLITGGNKSAVRLTAISKSQVQQDLDADGDGNYESTTTVNWNTLL